MPRILYECRDLEEPSGGVRRLYRHVEILSRNGFDASILHHDYGFYIKWFRSTAPVLYRSHGLSLKADDILVIPEGHTDVLASTALLPCRRVVIALNWANIFASLPLGLEWRSMGISDVIAGSEYEREFIRRTMGLDSTVIVSGTDGQLFRPALKKRAQIAYMPRKNANVFHLIAAAFRSRFPEHADVPFIPLDNLSHEEVAAPLGESACFLSTSFPEGLARPPLEAMACGCVVVGFAGRGSLEYMHHLQNCYLADDMDVLAAAEYLGAAVESFKKGTSAPMQNAARETALDYSLEREESTVLKFWRSLLARQEASPLTRAPTGAVDSPADAVRSIPNHFSFDDLYDRVVENAPPSGIFVEVGSWYGASTAYLANRIRESGKNIHLFAVDNFTAEGSGPVLTNQVSRLGGNFFDVFCGIVRRFRLERYVTPILSDSTAAANRFPNNSVDFAFIDACHDYGKVKRDILAWLPKIKRGGTIAGHDYDENHPGVMSAVDEIFQPGALEIMRHSWVVCDPHGAGAHGHGRSRFSVRSPQLVRA